MHGGRFGVIAAEIQKIASEARSGGRAELVILCGPSGSGKTTCCNYVRNVLNSNSKKPHVHLSTRTVGADDLVASLLPLWPSAFVASQQRLDVIFVDDCDDLTTTVRGFGREMQKIFDAERFVNSKTRACYVLAKKKNDLPTLDPDRARCVFDFSLSQPKSGEKTKVKEVRRPPLPKSSIRETAWRLGIKAAACGMRHAGDAPEDEMLADIAALLR